MQVQRSLDCEAEERDELQGKLRALAVERPSIKLCFHSSVCRSRMTINPIRYVEPVYRPPSEADSLILPVTDGCSWNGVSPRLKRPRCGQPGHAAYSDRNFGLRHREPSAAAWGHFQARFSAMGHVSALTNTAL